MNRFFKALLPAVMGWILCMVLSACENFLQGSDIQLQLENDIKYANAESYEIHVECGANEGQILTGTVLSKKVTDVFTVEFKASPVTCFLGWNAYEKKGNAYSPLSSDYVEFLEKETSSEGIHKTEVSLKKGLEGIYIKPLCYTVSPEPSQRSYANAPVILTFSEPVEEFENESNPFSYGQDNVQVLSGTNVLNAEDFFYKAEASLDRRSLMIQPKGKELKDFIDNQHLAFVTVSFSFGTEVCVSLNGKHFSLEGNSFSVKYIPSREEEPPLKYDLYALSEEIVFSADGTVVKKETGNQVQDENELFSFAEIGEFTDAEILRNRTAGTIYIYGKYHDADSGVKRISVAEQRVRNKNAGYVIAEKREVVYTLDNAGVQYFVKDGFTEFIVKHTLAEDSEDGAFAVNVKVQDACSNESEGAGFNAIKDTYLDLSNLIVQNYIDDLKKIYFTEEFTYTDQYYHDAQYVNFEKKVYDSCKLTLNKLSFRCEYTDDFNEKHIQPFIIDSLNNKCETEILNVSDIADFCFKVIVNDDFGISAEKEFSFPGKAEYFKNLTPQGNPVSSYELHFCPADSHLLRENETDFFHLYKKNGDYISSSGSRDSVYVSVTDFNFTDEYYVIKTRRNLDKYNFINHSLNAGQIGLYGEPSDCFFLEPELETPESLSLLTENIIYEQNETGYTDVKLSIAEESWSKYDFIYLQYMISISDGSNAISRPYSVFFDSGCCTATLKFKTSELIGSNSIYIYIYGFRNNIRSKYKYYTIGRLDINDYDNVPPEVSPSSYCTFETEKFVPCSITEFGSGIDYITIKNDSADVEYKYTLGKFIYSWDMSESPDGYTLAATDKTGQSSDTIHLECKCPDIIPEITLFTPEKFKVTAPSGYYGWIYYIRKFSNTDGWTYVYTGNKKRTDVFSFIDDDLSYTNEDGVFYRGLCTMTDNDQGYAYVHGSYFILSAPAYYCYNRTNSGDYDLLLPNGASKSSVAVSSDAPVLVQTLVTCYGYDKCKNWSELQWKHNRRCIGEKVLVFSPDDHGTKRYSIPVDEIDSGMCYCVVAHFADGSCEMSQVMQK